MNGERIEPEYIKISDRNEYKWKILKEPLNQRIIYNDKRFRIYKAKEVKILKQTLKEKKSLHTKKMNIFEYLGHFNGTYEEHSNDSDTNSTCDDIQENKIDNLEELIKKMMKLNIRKKNLKKYIIIS